MRKNIALITKNKKRPVFYPPAFFCFTIFLLLLCTGCADKVKQQSSTHFLMDTIVQIDVYAKDDNKSQEALKQALQVMQEIAAQTDRYSKSELSEVNESAGVKPIKVDSDVLAIAKFAKSQKHEQVDVTLGPIVDLWKSNKENKSLPSQEQIKTALDKTGMEKLDINEANGTLYLKEKGMSLDFGAVAKGYAVEQAGQFLAKDKNITCALVNGGGNIKVVGTKPDGKPWRIGVQDPRELSEYIGVLNLKAGDAVSTSGDYQRYYEVAGKRYHHLFDPATGYPAVFNISATAVTKDAFVADYYSTLLFVMPTFQALDFVEQTEGLHAIIIGSDMKVYISSGLKDIFKKNEESVWSFVQR